jgi:hypothetical protein
MADYPDGGYRTRVSEIPDANLYGGGGYGGLPDMSRMMRLAEERARQRLRMGDLEYDLAQRAKRDRYGPKLADWSHGDPNRVSRRGAESAGLQAAIAQSRAMTGAMPTRMAMVPGIVPGRTPDPMRMSGAQRQVFLPGGSQEIGTAPSGSAMFGAQRGQAAGQQAADEWGIARTLGLSRFHGLRGTPQGYGPDIEPEWKKRQRREEAEAAAVGGGSRRYLMGSSII